MLLKIILFMSRVMFLESAFASRGAARANFSSNTELASHRLITLPMFRLNGDGLRRSPDL